jgi:aldehyde:ferredoxin oxidoreductase
VVAVPQDHPPEASEELLVVHVTDEDVEFEPVPELVEATVPETTEYIEETHGLSEEHIACIGPGGENCVRFASIMTTESRAFGRGGLGAVLGSKNVKAITFKGDSRRQAEIPPVQMDVHRDAATSDHIMKEQGTTSVTDLANEVGALPTRYFSELSFEGVEGINGDSVGEKKYKRGTCSSCAFACKLPTRDEETGVETEGPEYETVMSFGSNCSVDDVVDVMKSNELCDRYGVDAISCGNVIAAYLDANDEFGNVDLIHEMVKKIAYRDGDGDLLAEGIDRFHAELGVENWTVKGLDFAAHDGRTLQGQGLSYAVANRGGDHMYSTIYSWEYPLVPQEDAVDPETLDGKAGLLVEQENARALEDCGIVCRFSSDFMTPERYEKLFGVEYDTLLEIGSDIVELERHFNNERGFDRSDDALPYELDGFEAALNEYYTRRGWTENGKVPDDHMTAIVGTR